MTPHRSEVSPWVERFADLIPAGSEVIDVAAGGGRHARYLADRGHRVVAVDRDVTRLEALVERRDVEVVEADLETSPWPFSRRFGGVVVTNYLHRPLFPVLLDALTTDGALIYETYALGQERFGRPTDPNFLLRPGELLDVVVGHLHVVAYEDLVTTRPARVQRIAAAGPPITAQARPPADRSARPRRSPPRRPARR